MVTRKKEDDSKPEKKAPAAKKAAAEKPVKKAPAAKTEPKTTKAVAAKAEKPVAQTTTSLVFQAPDPRRPLSPRTLGSRRKFEGLPGSRQSASAAVMGAKEAVAVALLPRPSSSLAGRASTG